MVTCQNWGNPSPTKLFPELSRDDFQIRKYPHYIIENKRLLGNLSEMQESFRIFH